MRTNTCRSTPAHMFSLLACLPMPRPSMMSYISWLGASLILGMTNLQAGAGQQVFWCGWCSSLCPRHGLPVCTRSCRTCRCYPPQAAMPDSLAPLWPCWSYASWGIQTPVPCHSYVVLLKELEKESIFSFSSYMMHYQLLNVHKIICYFYCWFFAFRILFLYKDNAYFS